MTKSYSVKEARRRGLKIFRIFNYHYVADKAWCDAEKLWGSAIDGYDENDRPYFELHECVCKDPDASYCKCGMYYVCLACDLPIYRDNQNVLHQID